MKFILLSASLVVGLSSVTMASPRIDVGLSCQNDRYEVEVIPTGSGNRAFELSLKNKVTGSLVDDNLYPLSFEKNGVVVALDKISETTVTIYGTKSDRISELKVHYKNDLLEMNEFFAHCDVID